MKTTTKSRAAKVAPAPTVVATATAGDDKVKRYQFKAEDLTDEGTLKAVFSVFDVIDSDGDVITSEAIHDGKQIPLVWSHDWSKPIGKGVIKNDGKQAIFEGGFFLNTSWGKDAYETVKGMGDLQEYSWGFRVLKQEKGEKDGRAVNFIKDTEEYEVSPVLVGANRETGTVEVKADKVIISETPTTEISAMAASGDSGSDSDNPTILKFLDGVVDGSYEELKDELNSAFRDRQFTDEMYGGYSYIVATFDDHFVAMMWRWDDEEESYWEVSYSRNDAGEILLGDPKQVEPHTEFVPVTVATGQTQTMSYAAHADTLCVIASEYVRRSKSVSDSRRKEGRPISSARRERMAGVATNLEAAVTEIRALLDETAPSDTTTDSNAGKQAYLNFLKLEAQLNGVLV